MVFSYKIFFFTFSNSHALGHETRCLAVLMCEVYPLWYTHLVHGIPVRYSPGQSQNLLNKFKMCNFEKYTLVRMIKMRVAIITELDKRFF